MLTVFIVVFMAIIVVPFCIGFYHGWKEVQPEVIKVKNFSYEVFEATGVMVQESIRGEFKVVNLV